MVVSLESHAGKVVWETDDLQDMAMFMRGKPINRAALVRQGAVTIILTSMRIHSLEAPCHCL